MINCIINSLHVIHSSHKPILVILVGHMELSSLLCSILLLIWLQPNGYLACIEEERIALLDIKLSVTADGHSFFQTWNISYSSDCCRWDRIRCSPITKRITNLDLSWDFQNGGRFSYYTLNISLFLPFKELRSLVLFNNGNTACLPIDCFQHLVPLKRLEYLDISANYFDGKTLASLAALRSLRGLALSGNGMQSDFFISGMYFTVYKLLVINA